MAELTSSENPTYRSTVVVDGENNIIEVLSTLVDYGARVGGEGRETFTFFELDQNQNEMLERILSGFAFENRKKKLSEIICSSLIDDNSTATTEELPELDQIISQLDHNISRSPVIEHRSNLKRKSLFVSLGDFEDIDPETEKLRCEYFSRGEQCVVPAKRKQIYCSHHLRIASKAHRRAKHLKRSHSPMSKGPIDYEPLFK